MGDGFCNRCGDCCDPVYLYAGPEEMFINKVDRSDEPGRESLEFARKHWEPIGPTKGGFAYECDQFNPDTRLCEAGDSRPPICRGYPWYGNDPSRKEAAKLSGRCSYRYDLPWSQDDFPDASRLLPVLPSCD